MAQEKEEKEEKKETKGMSPAKKAYFELTERYKIQNPVKYAIKKAAIEKKLASL